MKRSNYKSILFALALVAFVILIYLVRSQSVLGIDIHLSEFLQSAGGGWAGDDVLGQLAWFISFFGITLVAAIVVILTAIIFWVYKYKREAIFAILLTAASGINWLIKIMVDHPRPMDDLVRVLDHQSDASFPSGHTVFYTVFFGFIIAAMLKNKKIPKIVRGFLIIVSTFFIVTVAFSRIYLGAHWASDVLGGYLLGGICLNILLHYYHRQKTI